MKLGFNLLLWTPHVTLAHEPILRALKKTGYDGVEIPMFEGDVAHYAKLGELLDRIGLERSVVSVIQGKNPLSPDKASQAAALDYAKWTVDCSAALGAPILGGAAAATAHLIDRGRAPIAFVGRIATSAIGRARYEGYCQALKAHRLKVDPTLVWDISQGYRADAGHQATSEALAKGLQVRAIVAASDELALGCMAAAADRGLAVPGDLAVVGFGGLAWVGFTRPAMTTVALDSGAIARAVGEFFKARDSGAKPGKRRVIPAHLVLRQSA